MFIKSNHSAAGISDMVKKSKKGRMFFRAVLLMILVFSVLVLSACGKKGKDGENGSGDGSSSTPIVTPPEGMEVSTNPEIIGLVTAYYNALKDGDAATVAAVKKDVTEEEKIRVEIKAADIEYYDNLMVFDAPSVNADEYIVLVYSETKFVGIETKAPGVLTTYAKRDESGSLCINSNVDPATMEYVKQYISGEVVQTYFNDVKAAYANARANDPALDSYMQNVNAKLDEAVAARQQAMAEAEPTAETANVSTPTSETVTTTSKVNVRVSDSENADRLGQVEAGTTLTRYEIRENGWSKIDYNGQEGFIKSEYLKANTPTDTTAEGEPTTAEPTQTEAPVANTGKTVEAKETVKVRASASTDAEILGLIGPDMKFPLVEEQSDGWSKIDYNGKTGYVKTEFVTIK